MNKTKVLLVLSLIVIIGIGMALVSWFTIKPFQPLPPCGPLTTGDCIVLPPQVSSTATSTPQQTPTPTPEQSGKIDEHLTEKDEILVNRKTGTYKINLSTREINSYHTIENSIFEFVGLPKETKNKEFSVFRTQTIISQDNSQVIVVFTTFDQTKEPNGFDGSLPPLKAQQFICTIAAKNCSPSNILIAAYAATGNTRAWFNYPNVQWYKWNSKKNLLYGHLAGEGIGSASPVYIFDHRNKILQQTLDYNSLNIKEKRAEVPSGAFSPSLEKFVMIDESPKGKLRDTWDLLLYNSDDLSKPAKRFDISMMRNKIYGASRVGSIAWSADEKNLVLETENQIFTLNLEYGEIGLKYTDTIQDISGMWLDFNSVVLSPSQRFIVFMDYDKRNITNKEAGLNTVLKAIDLRDNSVSELLREEGIWFDLK